MAKFKSDIVDLVVSTETGFIQFVNHLYTTTKKPEIEALKKAKGVVAIAVRATPAPAQPATPIV